MKKPSKRKQPAYTEQNKTESVGVALIHSLVSECGHIWRDLTGKDIGFDGAIECIRKGMPDEEGGWAFVQVKTSINPFDKNKFRITFPYQQRHHGYWLRQNVPVLIVLVVRDPDCYRPTNLVIIDYRKLPHSSYQPNKFSCSIFKKRLSKPVTDTCILQLTQRQIRDTERIKQWLESAILSEVSLRRKEVLKRTDDLIESARPKTARREIESNQIVRNIREAPADQQARLIKALRRAGDLKVLNQVAKQVLASKTGPVSSRTQLRSIAQYELGFGCLIRALHCQMEPKDWKNSQRHFRRSGVLSNSQKGRLVALTGRLHSASLQHHFRRCGPNLRELRNTLTRTLGSWIANANTTSDIEDHLRREINARLAIARSYLAAGDLEKAKTQIRKLKHLYRRPECYHSPLWLVHLQIVYAWYALLDGQREVADTLIESVKDACSGFEGDPEIDAYLAMLAQL